MCQKMLWYHQTKNFFNGLYRASFRAEWLLPKHAVGRSSTDAAIELRADLPECGGHDFLVVAPPVRGLVHERAQRVQLNSPLTKS